jgi:hypothetical protein
MRYEQSRVKERFMATRRIRFLAPVIQLTLVSGLFWACGGDDDDSTGTGGKGGSSSAGKGSAGKSTAGKGGSSSAGKGGSGSSGKGGGGTGGSGAGEGGNAGVVETAGAGGGSAGNGEGGAGDTTGAAGMSQGGAAPFLSDICSSCIDDHCAVERTACEASNACSACLEHSGGNCDNAPLFQALAACACPSACDGGCSTECGDPKFYH